MQTKISILILTKYDLILILFQNYTFTLFETNLLLSGRIISNKFLDMSQQMPQQPQQPQQIDMNIVNQALQVLAMAQQMGSIPGQNQPLGQLPLGGVPMQTSNQMNLMNFNQFGGNLKCRIWELISLRIWEILKTACFTKVI